MDMIYAEEDMTASWTKYEEFTRLNKDSTQPVIESIAEFEKKYTKAKEAGCVFSDIVLGFNLLESCNLSETDEKFVLTGVDFKKSKENQDVIEQIKSSLRKFQAREKIYAGKGDRIQVKEEDLFVNDIRDALVAEGWTPPTFGNTSVKQNSLYYKGKKNPLGPDGKPRRCYRCQSEYHMADTFDQKPNQS